MGRRIAQQVPSHKQYGEGKLIVRGMKSVQAFEAHKFIWGNCERCPIGKACRGPKQSHVFFRGMLPCDVLLVGEAPGPDEAVAGYPFVGRAGQTLDKLLLDVRIRIAKAGLTFPRIAITNVIACFPAKPDDEEAFRVPTKDETENCEERLLDALRIANPAAVVYLGKVAASVPKRMEAFRPFPSVDVVHPSYINRKGGVNSLEFKNASLTITKFFKEHVLG